MIKYDKFDKIKYNRNKGNHLELLPPVFGGLGHVEKVEESTSYFIELQWSRFFIGFTRHRQEASNIQVAIINFVK